MIGLSFLYVRQNFYIYIIVCFACTESDPIFYCKPKLIFQHNGLLK